MKKFLIAILFILTFSHSVIVCGVSVEGKSDISHLQDSLQYSNVAIIQRWQDAIGQTVWVPYSTLFFEDRYLDPVVYSKRDDCYKYLDFHSIYNDTKHQWIPSWIRQKTLSSGNLLQGQQVFFQVHVDSVFVAKNYSMDIEGRDNYSYNKTRNIIYPDSVFYAYYVRLTPDTLATYNEPYAEQLSNPNLRYRGEEVLMPINFNLSEQYYTDEDIKYIAFNFYKQAQRELEDYLATQKSYYDIALKRWGTHIAYLVSRGEVRLGFDKDMCSFALRQVPYNSYLTHTPLGKAECWDYSSEKLKLYFQNDILIGIIWEGESLFAPRNRK